MKRMGFLIVLILITTLASCNNKDLQITFDTNDLVSVDNQTLKDGDELVLPEPILEGYTFSGWYYDNEFKEQFSPKDLITEDLMLYAKFVINQYKITVKSTNGDVLLVVNKDFGYAFSDLSSYGFDNIYLEESLSTVVTTEILGDSDVVLFKEYIDTKKIGVILPDAFEERWANKDGAFFEEQLRALGDGYEYEILFSNGNESTERDNVLYFIENDYDVIILTSVGSGAAAVSEAKEAGIPVIAHDRLARSNTLIADYYTSFNAWEVGKAMGKHLVDAALLEGCTVSSKCDLALFSGRTADWPNATYFFGGAFEELQPYLDIFNIVNSNPADFYQLDLYTEATFDYDAKNALQGAMITIDTDWNPETASFLAESIVNNLEKTSDTVFILAPADHVSAPIREEFAKMQNPYAKMFITGQDAFPFAVASLLGDAVKGKGTQSMTVFKDIFKLCSTSVAIAKNIVDGLDGETGLISSESVEGTITVYASIDILTFDNPQHTYDLLFATGYLDKNDYTYSNINFSIYE